MNKLDGAGRLVIFEFKRDPEERRLLLQQRLNRTSHTPKIPLIAQRKALDLIDFALAKLGPHYNDERIIFSVCIATTEDKQHIDFLFLVGKGEESQRSNNNNIDPSEDNARDLYVLCSMTKMMGFPANKCHEFVYCDGKHAAARTWIELNTKNLKMP